MNILQLVRSNLVEEREKLAAAGEEMSTIVASIERSGRKTPTADQDKRFTAAEARAQVHREAVAELEARVAELEEHAERAERATLAPTAPLRGGRDTWDGTSDARYAAKTLLERSGFDARSGDRATALIDGDATFAARFAACSSRSYESAFLKLLANPTLGQSMWTDEERQAWGTAMRTSLAVGTNSQGGYMLPTHLDPTIIITSSGWENPLRKISRVVTLTDGNVWHGVTSAGVVASFDAELAEVSDDSPTLGAATVTVHKAQALIQYSIEAEQDIQNLRSELARLLADAKGDLEAAKFANGSGSGEPEGVWYKLNATGGSQVTSTTAATIGEVDVHALYRALPIRHRRQSTWLLNPLYSLAVKRLGTAPASTYTGDLTMPTTDRILGRPVVEDDDAPATQTTTALDNEIILGNFDRFVIADKAGMSIELIPHMFNTSNNLPDGRRALYAHWRTGSAVVDTGAFRLLVDKTSA